MTQKKTGIMASDGTPASETATKPYVVLARKYRPQTFDDLIGQDAMVATLSNAFEQGRIAQGYMLTGVRGVGKTTTARIIARALNFEVDGVSKPTVRLPTDPAAFGRHCREIMESRHADVIEMDAASNTGIDNVREIIESARYRPLVARYKVYIIDEVHMLSKAAFNALLKTLEEPPEHVKFIFATTEIRKVPVTVLSRCQRFDLRRVDVPQLSQHFKKITKEEGASAEDEALMLIARAAGGSVRDGLSILDQAIAFTNGEVKAADVRAMLGLADRGRIFDLLDLLFAGRAGDAINALSALHRDGAEPVQVLTDLSEAVHLATRIKAVGAEAARDALSAEEQRRAGSVAERLSVPLLSRAWQMLLKGIEEVGRAPSPIAAAEMVLIRMAYTADLPGPEEVIKALGGESVPARRAAPAPATADAAAPRSQSDYGDRAPAIPSAATGGTDQGFVGEDPGFAGGGLDESWLESAEGFSDEFDTDDPAIASDLMPVSGGLRPDPGSFEEALDIIGQHRDLKLKVFLEEHVSLVKFDRATHSIELHLLQGAPPTIANELRERLNQWTSHHWMVALSKSPGAPPVAVVRRERQAAELERLKAHPTVAAALRAFPDAEIAAVRPIDGATDEDDDTGTRTG
ncbi:DNA polymerase-3 subunit gamma/tau [Filomicrobium insigne]|uniref:DNA polymerase III subunit gamma/tau n=1 Tax=Filomicrobium insigne TaxID=418854 RepID=A0A1H0GYI3_9HYPH|nr:DNA polymerase III subunit gamma/tau [Filomicrobium insigne]SDO11933.1 DNA polymerase-3 subunit gamma/tau [Filomicrobium insigne]